MKKQIKTLSNYITVVIFFVLAQACSDFEKYELPEAGSIPDATPPEALFTYAQGEGLDEEWKTYSFANLSTSAINYSWNFGDGNTSTEIDGTNTYPGEGTWTVTLTASDALGVVSTYSEEITVVEPEEPEVPDPTLINADFDKLPKSSGSDCSCAGWINKDIGEQGESSSGNGGSDNVVKFDNNEPDHVYQEFEVVPNAEYTIELVTSFKPLENNTPPLPSMLEVRILAGTGYIDGYTPVYYTDTIEFPQEDWGYTTVAQMEDPDNNLLVEVQDNPGDDGYLTYIYTFNAGANDSVALFIRGIGGDSSGEFGYNSGDEEIRADSVTITANN